VVLLLQAALGVAVRREWVGLRDPLYAHKAALLRAQLARPGAQRPFSVVMLGSSRTAFGLNSRPLGEQLTRDLGRPVAVFNFGVPAAGPVTERLYLDRLLADGLRPDLLLVEVLSPFLFGGSEPPEKEWLLPRRLRPSEFALANRYALYLPRPVRGRELFPWYAHRAALLSAVAPGWLPGAQRIDGGPACDEAGGPAEPIDAISPELAVRGLEITRRQYAGLVGHGRPGGPAAQTVADLLASCRARGVPAAVVLMPEARAFRGWYSPAGRAELIGLLEDVGRRCDAPLIDASEWVPDDRFADGHHLLPRGAAVFSERLGREALGPLIRTRLPRTPPHPGPGARDPHGH
jgi:hypothetical protein